MSQAMVREDSRTNSRIVAAYRQRTPGSADLREPGSRTAAERHHA